MAIFTYKALATDGTEIQGMVEALSKAQAVQDLSGEQYAVYEITEGQFLPAEPWYRKQLFQSASLSDVDIVALSLSLSAMLKQHLSIDEALEITAETAQRKPIRQALDRVRALVSNGTPIDAAFATLHTMFPTEFLSIVRAGGRSNTLASAFDSSAAYYARRGALRQKLLAAAAYPVFLIFAAAVVFIIILFTMVPALHDTLVSAGNDADGMIVILFDLSVFLRQHSIEILVVIALLMLALIVFRNSVQKMLLLFIPPLRRNKADRIYARVATMLRALLMSGEQLDRALDETIDISKGTGLIEPLEDALFALRRGETAGAILLQDQSVPIAFSRLFDLGEKTNNLPSLLELAANNLEQSNDRALSRMTGFLTPVLTLIVGAIIALLVQVLISAVLEVSQVAI